MHENMGMSDSFDAASAALVADLPELPSDPPEPDWNEHQVYAALVPAAERLTQLLDLRPAARPTGEIASFDPRLLSPAARIDLLTLLEEQKHWLESVQQQQVLAEIDAADASELNLSQEAVSLALVVPPRAAQTKLKTAGLLVRELPEILSLLRTGDPAAVRRSPDDGPEARGSAGRRRAGRRRAGRPAA